ncbi:hypothetical protein GCM10011581_00290 [Saccharopolyspora subtropica]|uniref:Uncharacterized protein n=1 Tax=Saccharopolyspora thermophila TaxID=89367 RepID=A0A917N7I9_9PSEU|nr:hypothetical protein GCM10011581_00290 [Saccharopolyspora subtropica]
MSEPNQLLRAAREQLESPSSPGCPMSRAELAELVNQEVYRATEKMTAVDANHVGKWERGVITWPGAHYRAALRRIFNVATDAELGFARRGTPSDVDRKTFLKAALGAGAGAVATRAVPFAQGVGMSCWQQWQDRPSITGVWNQRYRRSH